MGMRLQEARWFRTEYMLNRNLWPADHQYELFVGLNVLRKRGLLECQQVFDLWWIEDQASAERTVWQCAQCGCRQIVIHPYPPYLECRDCGFIPRFIAGCNILVPNPRTAFKLAGTEF